MISGILGPIDLIMYNLYFSMPCSDYDEDDAEDNDDDGGGNIAQGP